MDSCTVLNARLPPELWRRICTRLRYQDYWQVELDPGEYKQSLFYCLRGTCRALHEWCDIWEWEWVLISHVRQVKHLVQRLQASPKCATLIKVFEVALEYAWEIRYPHDWTICGSPDTWMFADRKPKKREFWKKHVEPNADEDELDAAVEQPSLSPEGWVEGPDGLGPDELVRSAVDFQDIMGSLVEQMSALRSLHWTTTVIPMNSRICRALAHCDLLHEVSLGPSGQCYSSLPQSPLWLIFEGREQRPLSTLILGIEALPSHHEFHIAQDYLKDPAPQQLKYLKNAYLNSEPLTIPQEQYARYLDYPYEDGTTEATLHFVERPLAMICRTLEASRGRVRQVQTCELKLAYISNFWPIWAQCALVGYQVRYPDWELADAEDPDLRVIREMHQALKHTLEFQEREHICDSDAWLVSFWRYQRLEPFAGILEKDQRLRKEVWQSFLDGYSKQLPDWERPPITENKRRDIHNFNQAYFTLVRSLDNAPADSEAEVE